MGEQAVFEGTLRLLVTVLDGALKDEECEGTGWLVRLDGVDAEGGNLGFKTIHEHPSEALWCFTAPDDWFAVGSVSDGWVHSLDPNSHDARQRMRMVALVARDGSEAMGMRRYGNDELEFMPGLGEGPMADVLRRVLGLPTPPPDIPVGVLMAKCWLQIVIAQAKRSRRSAKLGWEAAAALHPAMEIVDKPVAANNLPAVGAEIAGRMDWERLRRETARGSGAEAATAAWMDTGMFARWQANGRPPLDDLLKRAAHRLTPAAAERVRATLAGWGLLDARAA